ncbi:MAG: hypothetical protein HC848_05670 [Limnobacter sp.]|nr:hypothetical protein [Limnobacter sp.]
MSISSSSLHSVASSLQITDTESADKVPSWVKVSSKRLSGLQKVIGGVNKIAQALIRTLKNIDGIDETAASFALLRGITGPVLAEVVFLGGFPFVVLGFLGMLGESEEAIEALRELALNKQATLGKIDELLAMPGSTPIEKDPKKLRLAHEIKREIMSSLKKKSKTEALERFQQFGAQLALLKGMESQTAEVLFERCAAPFGNFAMGNMTLAMLPGMTWGAAEIAARALGQTTPEVASQIASAPLAAGISASAGAATSIGFAPANAAMVGYATLRGLAGVKRGKRLQQEQERMRALAEKRKTSDLTQSEPLGHNGNGPMHAPGGKQSQSAQALYQENQQAEKGSNHLSSVLYGAVTAPSQAGLTVSGGIAIAGFAGAAIAASAATAGTVLAIGGAAGAIGAAAMRIRSDTKAQTRRGDASQKPVSQRERPGCFAAIVERSYPTSDRLGFKPLNKSEEYLLQASNSLAHDKLLSLALHAIEQADDYSNRDLLMRNWLIRREGKRGALWGKGSTLLPSTRKALRDIYCAEGNPTSSPEERTVAETIKTAFQEVSKGKALQILLPKDVYADPASAIKRLHEIGELETFANRFTLRILQERSHKTQRMQTFPPAFQKSRVNYDSPKHQIKPSVLSYIKSRFNFLKSSSEPNMSSLSLSSASSVPAARDKEPHTTYTKNEYMLNLDKLRDLLSDTPEDLPEQTDDISAVSAQNGEWLREQFYQLVTPLLIKDLKNDSKVRIQQAIAMMNQTALYAKQEKSFHGHLTTHPHTKEKSD